MCASTRFFEAIPLRNIKTKTIVRALVKFFTFVVEEDHDIRSRSQLSKEQHKDPEISPLFQKAANETDLAQDPICFYIKNGILMRKCRSPEIPADDEWAVNHLSVVPKIYRLLCVLQHDSLKQFL